MCFVTYFTHKIFEPKRAEVKTDKVKLLNMELRNLPSSPTVIRVIKRRKHGRCIQNASEVRHTEYGSESI
jgi:hypothetical protein